MKYLLLLQLVFVSFIFLLGSFPSYLTLQYFEWLPTFKARIDANSPFQKHKTAPICWFEKDGAITEVIGGRDDLCAWTIKTHPDSKAAVLADKWINPFESDLTQQKTKK
jgi:hypothetical protein